MSDSNLVTISLRFDSVELKAFQRMYAGATLKTRPCLMLLVQCCARQEMLIWALFEPRRPLLLTLKGTYLSTVKGSVPSRPVPHLRGARDSPSTWKLRSATPRQMRVCCSRIQDMHAIFCQSTLVTEALLQQRTDSLAIAKRGRQIACDVPLLGGPRPFDGHLIMS